MLVDYQFTFTAPSSTVSAPPRQVVIGGRDTHEDFIVRDGSPLVDAAINLECEVDNPTRRTRQVRYNGTVYVSRQNGVQEGWVVHLASGTAPNHPERYLLEVRLCKRYNNGIRATFHYDGQFNSAAAGHDEAWEQVLPSLEELHPGIPNDEVVRVRETSKVLMWLVMVVIRRFGRRIGDGHVHASICWLSMAVYIIYL